MNRSRWATWAAIGSAVAAVFNGLSWASDVPVGWDNLLRWLHVPPPAIGSPLLSLGLLALGVGLFVVGRRSRVLGEASVLRHRKALQYLGFAFSQAHFAFSKMVDGLDSTQPRTPFNIPVALEAVGELFWLQMNSFDAQAKTLESPQDLTTLGEKYLRSYLELRWWMNHAATLLPPTNPPEWPSSYGHEEAMHFLSDAWGAAPFTKYIDQTEGVIQIGAQHSNAEISRDVEDTIRKFGLKNSK